MKPKVIRPMNEEERLKRLEAALRVNETICSSEGSLTSFPSSLCKPYRVGGLGLLLCRKGQFRFRLNNREKDRRCSSPKMRCSKYWKPRPPWR